MYNLNTPLKGHLVEMIGKGSKLMYHIGLRHLLRSTSVPTLPREPEGCDSTVVATEVLRSTGQ